jgi:hypothetical protein
MATWGNEMAIILKKGTFNYIYLFQLNKMRKNIHKIPFK